MENQALASTLEVVKQVGFPILVAAWFMLRSDKRLEAQTSALNKLTLAFEKAGIHVRQEEDD